MKIKANGKTIMILKKFITHWLIPHEISKKIYNIKLAIKHPNCFKRNEKIKDTYYGKRCFIIGNGPSLVNQDLNKLKNECVFAVNNYFLTDKIIELNPFAYVIADPAYFMESDFAIEILTKLDGYCKNKKTFFPISAFNAINKYNIFKNENIYYLNMSNQFNEDITKFDIDLTKAIPGAQTVIIMAIMIAAYMGFDKIYLIGCDSDWAKYPTSKGALPHFYNDEKINSKLKSHPISLTSNWKYENLLNAALIIFRSYRLLNSKLLDKGISIYNATDGGFLDVFERANYDELFNE